MEALNAAILTPISVLGDKKKEARKFPSLRSISLSKFSSFTTLNTKAPQEASSKSFHGGLLLLSSVFNAGFAKALTYEEALGQSVSTATGDFDTDGALESVIGFVNDNPVVIAGGFVLLAVPLVLSQVLNKKPKSFGVESAKSAYAKLGEDENAVLVDIRAAGEIKQVGRPDIRGLGKKPVPIAYKGFDGNSELVAELVTVNGFKVAYAIKDGAEGPRGWVSSGLPWISPPKGLSFDFGNLADAFSGAVGVIIMTLIYCLIIIYAEKMHN